jgi:hypothetical protein
MVCAENGRCKQALCCHSCMLPNVMASIILWLAMNLGLSSIDHHVACRLCREMMKPQNRHSIFRTEIHIYDHMESDRLLCCRQTSKWCQNKQRLLCDKCNSSTRISNLSSRKSAASKTTCDSSRKLFSSHKSGFKRLARRKSHASHAIATLFTWSSPRWLLLVSYSERKTRTDSGDWRRPIF